jgi:DNA-binding FrmR family transcriptional regulator
MAGPTEEPVTGRRRSQQAQKLSEARLARKRELDRQAQRSARVKTKNHISNLEGRIESLTRIINDNGNTKELVDQIEAQRKENEALQSTLKAIRKLLNPNPGEDSECRSRCWVIDRCADSG